MPIPSLTTFRRSTSKNGDPKKRGPYFAEVDAALEIWHQQHMVASVDDRVSMLYLLIKSAVKANERIQPKGGMGKKNVLAYRRKGELENLANAAWAEIERIAPKFYYGYQVFQDRKAQALERHGLRTGAQLHGRSLSGSYARERGHYLSTGKQFAYAGSNVSATHEGLQFDSRGVGKSLLKIKGKSFDSLSQKDFDELAVHGEGHLVTYYNKMQRLKFLVLPDGDGGFQDVNGDPIHMNDWGRKWPNFYVYAIDRYGNVFTRPAPPPAQEKYAYINHSSLNAGRDVMCAGCMWIARGRLRHIDNNSGHYKPSSEDLRNALTYLCDEGIDLSETRVLDVSVPGGNRTEHFALGWLNGVLGTYTVEDEERLGMVRGSGVSIS